VKTGEVENPLRALLKAPVGAVRCSFFCSVEIEKWKSGPRWWQVAGDGAVRRTLAGSTMRGTRRASRARAGIIVRGPAAFMQVHYFV